MLRCFADELDAFRRVGSVSDDVAETHDAIDCAGRDDSQRRLKRFEVSMHIGNDCYSHTPSNLQKYIQSANGCGAFRNK